MDSRGKSIFASFAKRFGKTYVAQAGHEAMFVVCLHITVQYTSHRWGLCLNIRYAFDVQVTNLSCVIKTYGWYSSNELWCSIRIPLQGDGNHANNDFKVNCLDRQHLHWVKISLVYSCIVLSIIIRLDNGLRPKGWHTYYLSRDYHISWCKQQDNWVIIRFNT